MVYGGWEAFGGDSENSEGHFRDNLARVFRNQFTPPRSGSNYQSEWVCPEHTGYARTKFEAWWKARSNDPLPATAEKAVELAEAGALAPTHAILVRSVAGEKYDRISDYQLGPIPPRLDGSDERRDVPADTDWPPPEDQNPF